MLNFSPSQGQDIVKWIEDLREHVKLNVELPVKGVMPDIPTPREIEELYASCTELHETVTAQSHEECISVGEGFGPLLKLAVLTARRHTANSIEVAKKNTLNSDIIDGLDARLKPFDELMGQGWFQSTDSRLRPRLEDFLTLGQAESIFQDRARLPERKYDEKFHILQAPALLLHDLNYYRDCCERRRTSVALAYLDIDGFKAFNTRYGETAVDRFLLPKFMAAMEAFVFGRGYAYRFGGDEYVVLFPNLDQKEAVHILDNLRIRIAQLRYHSIEGGVTVSVGLCVLEPQCFLTGSEATQRAERAKNYVKKEGKNRVGAYKTQLFREADMYIASGAQENPTSH